MIFLTRDDLLNLIDNYSLNVISQSSPDQLLRAEARSIEEMKGYLSIRYDIDSIFNGNDKNPLILMYLSDVVIYHLHATVMPDNIPELRKERYTNARDWMEKVADGFINPNLPAKSSENKLPLRYGSSSEKQEQYY